MNLFKKKTPWIIGTSVAALFLVIGIVGNSVLPVFANQINGYFGFKTDKTIPAGSDDDTEYFKKHFNSIEEQVEYEKVLCETLEAEGASLLLNKDNALPLTTGRNVSCFSQSSVNIIYGGTGSGAVSAANAPSLSVALKNAGFNNNNELRRFYAQSGHKRRNAETTGGSMEQYAIDEVPWSEYTDDVKASFKDYGDAAIVVISRSGGEGADLPNKVCADGTDGNYLLLSPQEKEMLQHIKEYKEAGTFKKIVVLLNGSNTLQLDWLDTYGVDAALWIGDVGTTGINAVAKILAGDVNPSGRIVDTFLKNNASSPAYASLGDHEFTNKAELGLGRVQANQAGDAINNCNSQYMIYQEGIYVGYRYYETRYADVVANVAKSGTWNYNDNVAFPFGSGISYTNFEYSDYSCTFDADAAEFTVSVKVTNTGNVDGKHTVQTYFSSPYTSYDKENGVEKSAIELCGFAKTGVLAKNGGSETVTIKVAEEELRAYDANKAKTYILDGGDYYFTVAKDSHEANNNVLASKGYTVANTSGRMDKDGDKNFVTKWNPQDCTETTPNTEIFKKTKQTGYEITNQFDNVDPNKYEGAPSKITYLTRKDWEGTFPTDVVSWAVTDKMWKDGLTDIESERVDIMNKMIEEHYSDAKAPTFGKSGDMTVAKMKGKDYNDEGWDSLLDQLTYAEAINCIYNGFHETATIQSINLPQTKDENGPQGYTASLIKGDSDSVNGMAYTSEDVMAATFNVDLLKDMGECIGEDCLVAGNAGLYGPGANTHRSQYDGRNFEYYSEDPFVSKTMCAAEVAAIESRGVYVLTKHFALNETEEGRYGLTTWANEQTIREIYLDAFEGSVSNSMGGVMSSFSRFGVVWAGANYNLMTNVLRNEWGGKGMAITDCSVFAGYMDTRFGVLAGQNLWDGNNNKNSLNNLESNPAIATAVRESIHRIAYSISNSLAMNGIAGADKIVKIKTPVEIAVIALIAVSATAMAACGGCLVVTILKGKKEN